MGFEVALIDQLRFYPFTLQLQGLCKLQQGLHKFMQLISDLQSQTYNAHFPPYRQAGALVEASLSLPLSVVQETFGILPTAAMDLALQLHDFFPVLLLTYGKQAILVNTPEVIMTPDCFEKLLTYDSSVQAQQKNSHTVTF